MKKVFKFLSQIYSSGRIVFGNKRSIGLTTLHKNKRLGHFIDNLG